MRLATPNTKRPRSAVLCSRRKLGEILRRMMRDGLSSRDRDLLCNEVLCKAFFQNIFTIGDKCQGCEKPISLFRICKNRQHRLTGTVGATFKVTSLSTRLATNMATFRRLLFESLESDFRNLEMLDQAMEIHENFIPHESQCSTEAVPFYYNLGMG